MSSNIWWSEEDSLVIRRMFQAGATDDEMASALSRGGVIRTRCGVENQRRLMGLKRNQQIRSLGCDRDTTLSDDSIKKMDGAFQRAMLAAGAKPGIGRSLYERSVPMRAS